MICQQVTLSGDAEWPKVADAMIEAGMSLHNGLSTDHIAPASSHSIAGDDPKCAQQTRLCTGAECLRHNKEYSRAWREGQQKFSTGKKHKGREWHTAFISL